MKILIAPDSFKENMDAATAARSTARGIHRIDPSVTCVELPISDGGEGLVDVLLNPLGAAEDSVVVTGPMGHPVEARFGWAPGTNTAVIEVAEACGIHLVPENERDIWRASTEGVGELLEHVRGLGAKRIIVGLGGSVTNDGGSGMLRALGATIQDALHNSVVKGPVGLSAVASVDLAPLSKFEDVEIVLASDVTNPLVGEEGASAVFGPQKGAKKEDVKALDRALSRWATALTKASGLDPSMLQGAGAAGGLGAAFMAGLGATLQSGIETVLDLTNFRALVADADLVITGEGKLDFQTSSGKAPWGVCQAALDAGVRTIALCGFKGPGYESLIGPEGFLNVVEIVSPEVPLEIALKEGPKNIANTAERVFREWKDQSTGGSN